MSRSLTLTITLSDLDAPAVERAARSFGRAPEEWARRVLARIAEQRGMTAGVFNPDVDIAVCPVCGRARCIAAAVP